MSEEKTQSAGTITEEAPGENTVQITFLPEGKTVQFEHGKLPYQYHGKEESILDVALNNHITLDHACGGNCACTTCHVWVKEGAENLSEMDDDEADRLDMAADRKRVDRGDPYFFDAAAIDVVRQAVTRCDAAQQFVHVAEVAVHEPEERNSAEVEMGEVDARS